MVRYELIPSDPTRKLILVDNCNDANTWEPICTVPHDTSWEAIGELVRQLGYKYTQPS